MICFTCPCLSYTRPFVRDDKVEIHVFKEKKRRAYGKALVRYKLHHNHVSVVLYIGSFLLLA